MLLSLLSSCSPGPPEFTPAPCLPASGRIGISQITSSSVANSDRTHARLLINTLQSDSGPRPLPEARFVLLRDGQPVALATSDSSGLSLIDSIAPGTYAARAFKLGMEPAFGEVTARAGITDTIQVYLRWSPACF